MYSVIVWHQNDVHGKHQQVLTSAKTLGKALRDFNKIMAFPASTRSFKEGALIQVHGPLGHLFDVL